MDLAPINERLDQIEARMLAGETRPQPRTLSVREAFIEQALDIPQSGQVRALADVISSGNSGLLPPSWASEVLGFVNTMRPMFAYTGTDAFPSTGTTRTWPSVAQEPTVELRTVEKSEPASQAIQTTTTDYSARWFAGALDLSQELLLTGDRDVAAFAIDRMFRQYAKVTNADFTLQAETVATPTAAALDFSNYETLIGQLLDASYTIYDVTGEPGNRLSLTSASFKALLGITDADGRRMFATDGPTNADGSAGLLAMSVNVGRGIVAYWNPAAAEDCQYNEVALRKAEKTPISLSQDVVAKMGRDVGILGAYIPEPLFPDGILVHSAA